MAKTNITQYSSTPSSNTDINNINIDENCPASGLNNAIRELMAHLKNVDTGSQALTALSVTGDLTVDTNTLYVDSANNRVGIGTTSPNLGSNGTGLHIKSASGDYGILKVDSSTTSEEGWVQFSNNGVDKFRIASDSSTNLKFIHSGVAERMRIDNSGNLLVSKTAGGSGTAGIQLESGGRGGFTKDNAYVTFQNRLSSDGEISRFMKDGTTVGSIGTYSGHLDVVGDTRGIRITDTAVIPISNAGAVQDNLLDLGYSGSRFKDLYLSGGVYLGGTGSSNYLDDYEEGTWTPALQDGSGNAYTTGSGTYGNYTKIGNQVFITARVNPTAANSANLNLKVTGLPFTGISQGRCGGTFSFADFGVPSGFEQIYLGFDGSSTEVDLRKQSSSGNSGLSATDIGTDDFGFSLTYIAS